MAPHFALAIGAIIGYGACMGSKRIAPTEMVTSPMQLSKQLAIFLDNRPGTLARLADSLAEARINIYALTTSDTVDHSVVRLVVSDYRKAIQLFEEHCALVVEDDVLMIEGSNKPGELARITHTLADARINIEYCYSATPPGAKKGLMIMRVSNPVKALKVLNSQP
jgi:hypothetical protein